MTVLNAVILTKVLKEIQRHIQAILIPALYINIQAVVAFIIKWGDIKQLS